jgi:hypothetical protein
MMFPITIKTPTSNPDANVSGGVITLNESIIANESKHLVK